MNTEATVQDVKKLHTLRDVERILRDAGVPRNFAELVAKHGYEEAKSIVHDQGEPDEEKKAREAIASLNAKLKALKGILDA